MDAPRVTTSIKPAYTLHRHNDIVEVHFRMPMQSHRNLEALIDACLMYDDDSASKRILFDIREVEVLDDAERMQEFAARAHTCGLRPTDRLAALAFQEQQEPQLLEHAMQTLGFQCRLFVNQPEALDWLRATEPPHTSPA